MDTLSVRMCVFCASNVKFVNRPLPSFLSFASAETNLCVKPVKPFILNLFPYRFKSTYFHGKGFARCLVLKQRQKVNRNGLYMLAAFVEFL